MAYDPRYVSNVAFTDLLFNIVVGLAFLFLLAFILMNPIAKDKDIEEKSDFIIILTWDDESGDDIDLWIRDPLGNLLSFRNREDALMHLDRDDLGQRNDVVQTQFGEIEYNENREIVTLRGIVPGEYVINVHMYMRRDPSPTTLVTVQLDKINPFSTIMIKRISLGDSGDEKTAFRFTLDKEGEVIEVNELPKTLTQPEGAPL